MPPLITIIPDDMLGRYRVLLQLKDPSGDLVRRFNEMFDRTPGAAYLEVMTFAILQGHFRLQPEIDDVPHVGGPDFKTTAHPTPLYVECKYLDRERVEARTALPDGFPDRGGSFTHDNAKIRLRISDACRQLERRPDGPGIAVIGTDHVLADAVMDAVACEWLLTGEQRIQVQDGAVLDVTGLANSVWLDHPPAPGDDFQRLLVPVSAVILMTFNFEAKTASMLGILNPWPRPGLALPIRHFPRLPFARFASTPMFIQGGVLSPVEWVIHQPDPLPVSVFGLEIPDHVVRGEEPPRRVI
ncbi:MAG TPA: hypothetical protein VKU80_10610 [Planctomycetota bacterium]|nr:hypothetical protein [Planctomycetota bacterium]